MEIFGLTTEYNAPLSAATAKSCGQKVKLRHDWEQVRVGLTERIVRAKFE